MVIAQDTKSDWLHRSFETYESKLVHYAWSIVGDLEAARDITQDTFVKLCREEPATAGDPPGPWLYRVCRNRAIDHYRKEKPMVSRDQVDMEEKHALEPQPDQQAVHREERDSLLQALASLPEREQEIVRLKFLHGLRYKEIAKATGLSATNVGFILHQALLKLRKHALKQSSNETDTQIGRAHV